MKAIINEDGYLHLERGNKMKRQNCPYITDGLDCHCGDWCPHFDTGGHENLTQRSRVHVKHSITLCQNRTIEVEELIDKRISPPTHLP